MRTSSIAAHPWPLHDQAHVETLEHTTYDPSKAVAGHLLRRRRRRLAGGSLLLRQPSGAIFCCILQRLCQWGSALLLLRSGLCSAGCGPVVSVASCICERCAHRGSLGRMRWCCRRRRWLGCLIRARRSRAIWPGRLATSRLGALRLRTLPLSITRLLDMLLLLLLLLLWLAVLLLLLLSLLLLRLAVLLLLLWLVLAIRLWLLLLLLVLLRGRGFSRRVQCRVYRGWRPAAGEMMRLGIRGPGPQQHPFRVALVVLPRQLRGMSEVVVGTPWR